MFTFFNARVALAALLLLGADETVNRWKPWNTEGSPLYAVERADAPPELSGKWDAGAWQHTAELKLEHFLGQNAEGLGSGGFRPDVRAKVLYDAEAVYIFFRVKDQFVRSVANKYRGNVWEDACAEFFVQPKADRGYFNFEINCGGSMLLSYHENPDWTGETQAKAGAVPWELARDVRIYHSMPQIVNPEITEECVWQLEYRIPLSLFETYIGPLGDVSGQEWRANFYKCAETNSHPNWATWSPILEGDNFHSPKYFGVLQFK